MSGNLKHCIIILKGNEESVKNEALLILSKVCKNILTHPNESNYRKIRLANTIVANKLLPAAGAIECLLEAGFIEDGDGFLLPLNASLEGIQELYNLVKDIPQPVKTQPLPCISAITQRQSNIPLQSPIQIQEKRLKQTLQSNENTFLKQLVNHFQAVLRYEDKSLQNKVKSILPFAKIQITALENLRKIQKEMKIKNDQDYVVFEDLLLSELLNWFKHSFFKWVDSPVCKNCKGECSFYQDRYSPNPQISRIEIHKCKSCSCESEFPRYTDPEPLLYTRQGRCGEWANCFTLICRTVGFDARLVYDQTDHVWTEVWSIANNRWIHADVCENVMDRPLMYEKGWGKKLSYIIAFSKDEIQDVTWRYTNSYNEVMKRRNLCSEVTLMLFINKLNLSRQNSNEYSSIRKKFVIRRSAFELANMINAPPGYKKPSETLENESNYGGRISGSQAWRMSRGEIGNVSYKPVKWKIPQKITNFELIYSINGDSYTTRDVTNDKILETKQKWQNGVELLNGGVFMKKEEDWKMIYLARAPESKEGKITWSFAVENANKTVINSVNLQATTATFHEATIDWELEGTFYRDAQMKEQYILTKMITGNFQTTDFHGAINLRLSAILRGGKGETAWQHAQLFRQSLSTDSKEPSMVIKITLHNKNF